MMNQSFLKHDLAVRFTIADWDQSLVVVRDLSSG